MLRPLPSISSGQRIAGPSPRSAALFNCKIHLESCYVRRFSKGRSCCIPNCPTMPLAVDPVDLREPSKLSPSMLSPKKTDQDSLASPSQMMMTGSMVHLAGYPAGLGSPFSPPAPPQALHHRMPKFHEFQCPLCPRSYAQKCSLYRHMKVHKNDKINESEVQQVPCTTGEGQFKCPFCIASYANAASLNVHVRTHAVGYRDMVKKPESSPNEDAKIFPCPLCSRVFQRRSRLTVHLNISHRHEAHKAGPLNLTMNPGEDDDPESDLDEEALDDAVDLSQSAGVIAPSSPSPSRAPSSSTLGAFACHLCGSSYTRRTNLNKHLEKRHHIDQSLLPKGTTADMDFLKKKCLEEEMRVKMMGAPGDVVHTCPFCPFKTSHRFSLYQHMTTTHATKELMKTPPGSVDDDSKVEKEEDTEAENGNGEIFPCSFCTRVYLRKCNLTQHMKMHFQEDADLRKRQLESLEKQDGQQKPMEQFCNDVEDEVDEVRRIIELTRTQSDATKSSVHECAICGLTFGVRPNLLLHLQMHEKRALDKKDKKKRSPSVDQPPPLIRPGMTPEDPGFVMTQGTDGKTTIHNQEAYMLSHLQVLNQVQRMLMYGRQPHPNLTSPDMPKKRLSTGSLDEENAAKKMRMQAPKLNNRHWKLQDCDPNRRPVLKCSLCLFEISDANQDGLLQHMAAMHGVRCKLCPEAKFFAKRDFDDHCANEHSQMCQANEMEQLMVFGEIVDSGCKTELINGHNDADSDKSEGDASKRSSASPGSANGDDVRSNPSLDGESDSLQTGSLMGEQMNSGGSTNGTPMRQICPKCGLHYAQKSSLNRHIRTHHNYSRVEEMVKAETIGLPSARDGVKDLASLAPLLPPPHMLSPHMMGLPGRQGIPAQGLMPDMSQLLPRSLLFGAHGFPPLSGNLQESKDQMMQRFLNHEGGPESIFKAMRQQNEESRSCTSPEDEEVSAMNLSLSNPASPQDLSIKKEEEMEERASVSPPAAAPRGRSRRKPQVVQRIVRNTTLEEEEDYQPITAGVAQDDSDNDSLENEYGPQTGFDSSAFRAAQVAASE